MRERAESAVQSPVTQGPDPAEPGKFERIVHELGVHQVELEMQNDQLLQTQGELETARDLYRDLYEHAPSGYVSTDAEGLIVQANGRAAALLGLPPEHLLKRSLAEFVAPDARPRLQLWMRQLLRHGGVHSLELPLRKADGASRWIAIEMLLVADGPQATPQCRLALMDVTERVELRHGTAQLAAIVSSSEDAIVGRDRLGRITSWNAGAQRLFGADAMQMVGRTMEALVPPERHDEETDLLRRLRHAEKLPHVETERLHADGRRLAVAMSLSPIIGADGLVAGSSLIARDIGERKRAERSLHRRLRQLDLLSQAGQMLILGEGGPAQIQHDLFDRVRLAVGAEIWLRHELDSAGTRLQLTDAIGLGEAQHAALGALPPDGSLCGLALRHGVPVIVEDLQASERPQAAALKAAGLCSFAAFPLRVQGRVCAVSSFASTTRTRFREGDLQVIQTVCDQVSAMLERSRLLDELHQREQALRQADRAKDDFIATLAHELRNPLAPISNATGILRRAALVDPKLLWCRDVIERQVLQMTHLLEDLLDVSRVTRNKIELRRERIDLMRAIEQAQEAIRPLIEQQSHRLVVEPPPVPLRVFADLTRLTQVFANLLNNAAKYTDSGGLIELRVTCEDDAWARIAVRDNGIGIEAGQLPRVFDMFAQLTPALERSRGGLGIGLSLAHGLVELHGGRIEAHSAGPGRGSEFVVHLPLLHAAHDAPAQADEVPAAPVPTRHRLLVVDDNEDAAQTLALMLGLHGQEVRTAHGGQAALELAQAWRPDTAVVDIGMPDLNGYEVCRRIRQQSWGEHMLLIACTGWGQAEDRQRARAAGFDAHLVKPVDADALLRLLAGQGDPV